MIKFKIWKRKIKRVAQKNLAFFFVIGVGTTLIDFVFYSIVAALINNNDLLVIPTFIGGTIGTIAGYFLNSRLIWKHCKTSKREISIFFIYNAVKTFGIKALFTWFFKLLTPIYDFAFSISSSLHLPFTFDTIERVGVFGFTALSCMLITYFTYDKIVFKNKENDSSNLEEN